MQAPDKGSPPGETAGLKGAQAGNGVQMNHHCRKQTGKDAISEVVPSHCRGKC